jgi:transposase
MKQKEIAQMLGVNQSTVQRWLKPSSNYAWTYIR